MAEPTQDRFGGFTKKRWTGLILVWLAITFLFIFLYLTSRRAVVNEIRSHVMGVAIATVEGIQADDIEKIHNPGDMEKEEFRRVQNFIDRVSKANTDVRYIYVMRKSREPFAPPTDYEYIVDQSPQDFNQSGEIDRDEESEMPGNPYDASTVPEMVKSWERPGADWEITPDPPYPDLISGYAPIKDENNQTVALVGVDITANTVGRKMAAIRIVMVLVWLVIGMLSTTVMQLYYQQRDAFEKNKLLSEELANRNEMLRAANSELAKNNDRFQKELKLAQTVQLGFLPKEFPRQDRIIFDKYYLTCAILGGDLFDVFDIDDDHVAMYMADVAGHGVSAALISGLLRMAIASVREQSMRESGHLYADLTQPDKVLKVLNDMLVKEMPENEFITLIYAVVNLTNNSFVMANAGHPFPLYYSGKTAHHEMWNFQSGMALGLHARAEYPTMVKPVYEGDKVLFYTDGLTEAMDIHGNEFGEDRLRQIIVEHGHRSPSDIIKIISDAVSEHRGSHEVSDDFALLVAEIR